MARVVYLATIVGVVTEDDVLLPPLPKSGGPLPSVPGGELPRLTAGTTVALEPCFQDRSGRPVAVVYLDGLRPSGFSPK